MRVISKESIDRENRMDTLDLRHDLDSPGRARNYLIYIRRVNSPGERSSIKGGGGGDGEKRKKEIR